jgi:hypothetical protein
MPHPLILLAGAEGAGYLTRANQRMDYYNRARLRSRALGRPLVVVGAPDGGMTGGYSCGDYCVDLRGCRRCGSPPADLTKPHAIPVRDDGAVVFSCCVMELVNDPEAAWRETMRAAGSMDNVFVVRIQPWTLTKIMYPDVRWQVDAAPPSARVFRCSPVFKPMPEVIGRRITPKG